MAVTDKYIDRYNAKTITQLFAKYDITATNADKESEIVETESIFDAQFLKRGFKRHPTRDEWLSPLKWTSILSATQWVWQSNNMIEATYINAEAALIQAHGHGPEKFNAFKRVLNRALAERKLPVVMRTWEELDVLFYDTEGEVDLDLLISRVDERYKIRL